MRVAMPETAGHSGEDAARRMARMLDAEPDRELVLARFVPGLSGADEELLRRAFGEGASGRG